MKRTSPRGSWTSDVEELYSATYNVESGIQVVL